MNIAIYMSSTIQSRGALSFFEIYSYMKIVTV